MKKDDVPRKAHAPVRFHIHWFKFSHRNGNNIYKQCRCGAKRVEFLTGGGYSPLDTDWLKKKQNDPRDSCGD